MRLSNLYYIASSCWIRACGQGNQLVQNTLSATAKPLTIGKVGRNATCPGFLGPFLETNKDCKTEHMFCKLRYSFKKTMHT